MAYKRTDHTVYVVHWPELNVFKVGCSERQRWRMYVLRGADLLDLRPFSSARDAYEHESRCHRALEQACRPAFRAGFDAERFLGSRGDGYRECYRTPAGMTQSRIVPFLADLLKPFEQCSSITGAPVLGECSSIASSNPRTYERTDVQLPTLASYLTLGIARRGVAGFSPSRSESSRPAALRAGRIEADTRA